MSIRNGYVVHRAKVHSVNTSTGFCMVSIPAMTSRELVPVPPTGLPTSDGDFVLPAVGDTAWVAADCDRSSFLWIVSADATAMWAAIDELRELVE